MEFYAKRKYYTSINFKNLIISIYKMILDREIKPCFNPDNYWAIFVVGFAMDILLHYLAKRGYEDLPYGFGRALMPYYNSLRYPTLDPLKSLDWPTFKSWVYGGLISGFAIALCLLLSDLFLKLINWFQKKDKVNE